MGLANFLDEVRVYASGGDGGDGFIHYRRSRSMPKGGPDGGDGGNGGDVLAVCSAHCGTLWHLRYTRHVKAERGGNGGKENRQGGRGSAAKLILPVGTEIRNKEGKLLAEVLYDKESKVILKGGKGGRGNGRYGHMRGFMPSAIQKGYSGEKEELFISLKLMADVGLVGLPNVGKSTLLRALSGAKPKVANYAFTTLEPSLGQVMYQEGRHFTLADLPGIIEGAHEGKGLGLRFLRHMERNRLLIFVICATYSDKKEAYEMLRSELGAYKDTLAKKPHILVISRCDRVSQEAYQCTFSSSLDTYYTSSHTGMGLSALKAGIWEYLQRIEK